MLGEAKPIVMYHYKVCASIRSPARPGLSCLMSAYHLVPTTDHVLRAIRLLECPLHTKSTLLLNTRNSRCSPHGTHHSLLNAHHTSFTSYSSPLTTAPCFAHHSLLVIHHHAHHSLLTTRGPLLTSYHSSLTSQYTSPLRASINIASHTSQIGLL